MTSFVNHLMATKSTRIAISSKRDELEWPIQSLGNSLLDQTRLSNARGANQEKRHSTGLRIGDLTGDELENLKLRLLLAVDCIVQTLLRLRHKSLTNLRAILNLDRHLLPDSKRK